MPFTIKDVGVEAKNNKKEALKYFKAAYGLGNQQAERKLKSFYKKREEQYSKAETGTAIAAVVVGVIVLPTAPVFSGACITFDKKVEKYKNKAEKLNQNFIELLRHKYNFMYDKQGNFKNKNNLKSYNLKKARRKSAKFIFNALKSNELNNRPPA